MISSQTHLEYLAQRIMRERSMSGSGSEPGVENVLPDIGFDVESVCEELVVTQ